MKKLFTIALVATALASCQTKQNSAINFKVNDAISKAEWKGSAPDHFHVGSFKVTGNVTTDTDGQVKAGDFVIPIASIQDFDLKDPVRQVLLSDLRDNFFKVAINPNAKFHLTQVTPYTAADTGAVKGANYLLTGNFTMLGQTHELSFPAKVTGTTDSLVTEAKFALDRLKWGMNNYSDASKKLYILPKVNIHLLVNAGVSKPAASPLAYIGYVGGN